MREKLLLAATLTVALKLFAGVNWSFSSQTNRAVKWQNDRVVTVTQLNRYVSE
ncbi:hypothetical protein [Fortiea contorta]|uniref:hypothetical protein n=1 Tax=Fortiea contorta TaxID=1892405 RepID=UPI0003492FF5|nr:hypothetical protein [Fortiea contorta]